MRNMSFAITTDQVYQQTKDVTRRLGWQQLRPGEIFQPVKKCMGLRPGEKIERIGPPVRLLDLKREPLSRLLAYPNNGRTETRREGFPDMTPGEFIAMFCNTHRACTPNTEVSRIVFSYDLLDGWQPMATAPKDGTYFELLVRHTTWYYEEPGKRDSWQGPCRANWTDFNGGGWAWSGHSGEPLVWRPV